MTIRKKLIEVSIPLEAINEAAAREKRIKTRKLLKNGTKSAKGQAFLCVVTGSPIDRGYIQAEGKADRLSS
jgi:hypothetical protein